MKNTNVEIAKEQVIYRKDENNENESIGIIRYNKEGKKVSSKYFNLTNFRNKMSNLESNFSNLIDRVSNLESEADHELNNFKRCLGRLVEMFDIFRMHLGINHNEERMIENENMGGEFDIGIYYGQFISSTQEFKEKLDRLEYFINELESNANRASDTSVEDIIVTNEEMQNINFLRNDFREKLKELIEFNENLERGDLGLNAYEVYGEQYELDKRDMDRGSIEDVNSFTELHKRALQALKKYEKEDLEFRNSEKKITKERQKFDKLEKHIKEVLVGKISQEEEKVNEVNKSENPHKRQKTSEFAFE